MNILWVTTSLFELPASKCQTRKRGATIDLTFFHLPSGIKPSNLRIPLLRMHYSEKITEKLQEAGWKCDRWTTFVANTKFFVLEADSRDGRRFIVQSDDELHAFLELERLAELATKV
jgi:hypothetical protein